MGRRTAQRCFMSVTAITVLLPAREGLRGVRCADAAKLNERTAMRLAEERRSDALWAFQPLPFCSPRVEACVGSAARMQQNSIYKAAC